MNFRRIIKRVVRTYDEVVARHIGKIPPSTNGFFAFISNIGTPAVWIGIVILIALVQAMAHDTDLTKTGLILLFLPLSGIIKLFVRRDRPATIYASAMRIKSYSFPSSHAYVAALGGGYVALIATNVLSKPWSIFVPWLVVSMILTIAVSRVHLGAHYPSDVSVGLLLGASILLTVVV